MYMGIDFLLFCVLVLMRFAEISNGFCGADEICKLLGLCSDASCLNPNWVFMDFGD